MILVLFLRRYFLIHFEEDFFKIFILILLVNSKVIMLTCVPHTKRVFKSLSDFNIIGFDIFFHRLSFIVNRTVWERERRINVQQWKSLSLNDLKVWRFSWWKIFPIPFYITDFNFIQQLSIIVFELTMISLNSQVTIIFFLFLHCSVGGERKVLISSFW